MSWTIQPLIANQYDRYLLGLINDARSALGHSDLTLELNLNGAAVAHSDWMIDNNSFTHEGAIDSTGLDRMNAAGFDLGTTYSWSENLGAEAIGFTNVFYRELDVIFAQWMDSPSHQANLLNPEFEALGIGLSTGDIPGTSTLGMIVTVNFAQSDGDYDLDIAGSDGADILRGQGGDDHFLAFVGDDLVFGNAGNDRILADGGNDSVNAGVGDDVVVGGDGNDFLRGAAGFDRLFGDAGNDFLLGDGESDVLVGGIGQDSLSGGDGNDYLDGNAGFDALQGGNGNDTLNGGAQADNLFAGAGDDSLQGGAGFDRLFGGWGNDTLEGGDGPDALFGNGDADEMYGQDGDDRNYGAGGNDYIWDGAGDDLIEAGAGFDTLDGGAGDDLLYGRFNADFFRFSDAEGAFGNDTIGDFAVDNFYERIDLRGVDGIFSLEDMLATQVEQIGADALITAGVGSSILLLNVSLADLGEDDFIF